MPFQYNKNAINGELQRAKKISSNFQLEKARITVKFLIACFPDKTIENTINNLIMLTKNLLYQDSFLMKEKQL